MAPHSSTLAWKIPWTQEPGGLQSMGSQRVGHNLVTKQQQLISFACKSKSPTFWAPVSSSVKRENHRNVSQACWEVTIDNTYKILYVQCLILSTCLIESCLIILGSQLTPGKCGWRGELLKKDLKSSTTLDLFLKKSPKTTNELPLHFQNQVDKPLPQTLVAGRVPAFRTFGAWNVCLNMWNS